MALLQRAVLAIWLLAGPALAQSGAAAPPYAVTNPDWLRKPQGRDLARFYPDRAQREEVGGAATILCSVTVKGGLEACRVVSEAPVGYGFGQAALRLSQTFQMKPKMDDGTPVAGGTVRIPIVFRVPEEGPAERKPSPSWLKAGIAIELFLIGLLARLIRWCRTGWRPAPRPPG